MLTLIPHGLRELKIAPRRRIDQEIGRAAVSLELGDELAAALLCVIEIAEHRAGCERSERVIGQTERFHRCRMEVLAE